MQFNTFKISALALFLGLKLFGADTSMFRANPQHTGVYKSSPIVEFSRVKWKFHAGPLVVNVPN